MTAAVQDYGRVQGSQRRAAEQPTPCFLRRHANHNVSAFGRWLLALLRDFVCAAHRHGVARFVVLFVHLGESGLLGPLVPSRFAEASSIDI